MRNTSPVGSGERGHPRVAPAAESTRRQFLDEVDRAYACLRADPEAWQAELSERAVWDATLADGLEDE